MIAVVIGQVTPPMAIALIVSSRIAEVDQIDVLKANTPFLIALVLFLFLLAAVPGFSTWLPGLIGL